MTEDRDEWKTTLDEHVRQRFQDHMQQTRNHDILKQLQDTVKRPASESGTRHHNGTYLTCALTAERRSSGRSTEDHPDNDKTPHMDIAPQSLTDFQILISSS